MAKSILDIVIKLSKEGGADKETVKGLISVKTAIMNAATVAGTLVAAGYTIKKVFDETVGTLVAYADQVRRLSDATGTSAEDSSKLIQVMDDMFVSYDQLEKAVAKSGKTFDFSIEGLAKMSDEYLKLTDTQQQAAFMQERFGKQWISFVPVMQKGGQAIRDASSAVEESLVLDQQALDQTLEYKQAVDSLADAWEGVKVKLGRDIIPLTVTMLQGLSNSTELTRNQSMQVAYLNDAYRDGIMTEEQYTAKLKEFGLSQYSVIKSTQEQSTALDENSLSAEENAAAIKLISDANKELLSLIGSLQSAESSYGEQYKTISADMSLTDDERKAKLAELAAEHDLDTKKIILNLLEQKLAQDGLTTTELNYLLQKGQAWGIYSASVVSEARKAIREVDDIARSIDRIPDEKNVSINITTTGSFGAAESVSLAAGGSKKRDAGGPGIAGRSYRIGTDEIFSPASNGQFVPLHGAQVGGSNVTVVLNISSPVNIMDEQTTEKVLLPYIIKGVRQAQTRGALK